MKKIKLLNAILPIAIVGSSLPLVVTSCGNKDQSIASMSIDDSSVEKERAIALDEITSYVTAIDYTGFAITSDIDINNIKVVADWNQADFDGAITTKIIKVDDKHFNVKVVFQADMSPLVNQNAKFDLVFTNKLNVENKQTVSGLSADFVYGNISITHNFSLQQKLITGQKQISFYGTGQFTAYKVIGTEIEQITDFSNFSVEAYVLGETSMTVSAQIVPYFENTFVIKLSLENIENITKLPMLLTFKNKVMPDWYQTVQFKLTVSDDITQGFEYEYSSSDQTATITACNIQDESIKIPEEVAHSGTTYKVTKIGRYCFQYCLNLRNLTITENINDLGNYQDSPLKGTMLDSLVVDEENETFTSKVGDKQYNCIMKKPTTNADPTELVLGCKGTQIPTTITTIDKYAFEGALGLESIVIPDNVTTIDWYAFSQCWGLKSITLSKNVKTIPQGCFYGCISLEKADIPETVTEIGTEAYRDSGIKSLYLTKNVVNRGDNAFNYCPQLEEIKCQEGCPDVTSKAVYKGVEQECNCIYDASSKRVCLACKNTLIPDDAEEIIQYAYAGSGIVNLTIPSQIKEINSFAFDKCPYLETVNFEGTNDVTIGTKAFNSCASLKTVELPANLTKIGSYAFALCTSLQQCVLPSKLEEIGEFAFLNCVSLKMDSIPASLKTIKTNAFTSCISIDKLVAPENSQLQTLGSDAFIACTNLTELDLSKATLLTALSQSCFSGCSSLGAITLPSTLTTIGSKCFNECTGLKEIRLPSGLTSLKNGAFTSCSSLESVTFTDNTLTTIGSEAFSLCLALTSVTFSNNTVLETIDSSAFAECMSLESITLPNTVKVINYSAFERCLSLANVTLSSSLTTIGARAFYACESLESITIPSTVTSIGMSAFTNCHWLSKAKFEDWQNWKNAAGNDVELSETEYEANATKLVECDGWTKGE